MTDYLQLLKSHDDPRHGEQPPGFDRYAAEARFAKMAEEIVSAFPGSRFETGVEIQDASFHGQIFIASAGRFALIRVSNFGGFVTFCGNDDDCLTTEARDGLLDTFAGMATRSYHLMPCLHPTMAVVVEFRGFEIGATDSLSGYEIVKQTRCSKPRDRASQARGR